MPDAAQPILQDPKTDRCPRCLEPLPVRASRCPNCGQPIHSRRLLPLAIGIAGLFALLFAMLLMYRMATNEEDTNAPPPVDEDAQEQPLFRDPPADSKASEPAKPEKKPPLNER
jgi:predicted amidophosphoribosyltransferase